MQAIQTQYKGYRFRSRLEARWAVFFDALGVTWEYEPEGFQFDDGSRYLPDFWLPNEKLWVEVKGPEPTEEEKNKAELLFFGSGWPVAIVSGQPGDHSIDLICFDMGESSGGPSWWADCQWHFEDGILKACVTYSDRTFWGANSEEVPGVCGAQTNTSNLLHIFHQARGARFEHGECPQ